MSLLIKKLKMKRKLILDLEDSYIKPSISVSELTSCILCASPGGSNEDVDNTGSENEY